MNPNDSQRPGRVPPPPPVPLATAASRFPSTPRLVNRESQHLMHRIRTALHSIAMREYAWLQRWSPRWLRPTYTWPHHVMSIDALTQEMPRIPIARSSIWSKWMGYLHCCLQWFAEYYCAWYGHEYSSTIVPLPFGLIMKWSDGTTFDEAESMITARAANFPCPKVVSIGEHPSSPSAPVSILMTRLPGEPFDEAYDDLTPAERDVIVEEMKAMLFTMRQWKSPWGQRVCSISGGSIRSIRVPNHRIGPCETELELMDHLLAPASRNSFDSAESYENALQKARCLADIEHRIVFTHGDLALHNILVFDGHVAGFIDWEFAGWYPEYWEFTTPLRWPGRDREGGAMFRRLGGERYEPELEAELALRDLTVDSWISV